MKDFEKWLRTACFQKPTPEAYDLAKEAWEKSKELEREVWRNMRAYWLKDSRSNAEIPGRASGPG